jgi:hypothetical protein
MDIKKLLNREIITAKAKEILRKPLFYLPPLFAILYLIIVPIHMEFSDIHMEFSDIKITRNGKTENIELPYSVDMASGEVFIISYDLLIKNKKTAKYNIIPDDCIQEILINGKNFPLDGIQGLCDYTKGVNFDFSKYVKEGLNHFEFRIMNAGYPGGLQVKIPNYNEFRTLPLIQHIFILLFLLFIVLTLKKLHNVKLNQETIFVCVLAFPFVLYAFVELCIRINYELSGAYELYDAPIYYAVGRGIANGIAPYSGLWDIKPPGIFLVSAISFKFFDSPAFTYYSQVFVLILTAAVPIVAYFLLSSHRSVLKWVLSLLAGLLLALYSAERSGEFQVESFGAAFGCIAVFAMAMPNFEKRRILWTSLAVIGILGACGFKEPFLFPLFGISLIFCKDIKEWASRFALPLAIAVLLGFVFLLVSGWLGDFLHYLDFMFSAHISRFGSPFRRAMDFSRIYNDMNAFSWGLAIAVLVLLSLPFIHSNSKSNENNLFIKIIFFGVAFFLSSYSVGVGGEYYGHHFVFALPFYMALVLLLLKKWNGENFAVVKLGMVSFIFLAIATLNLPNLNLDMRAERCKAYIKNFKEAASYLDKKMDSLGIDRYVFIGGQLYGINVFGWTKHSPTGPYFNQPPQWFQQPQWFVAIEDSMISNIKKADAVVIGKMEPYFVQANYIYSILDEQFTKEQINRFPIYFRKNKMRQ